MERNVFNFSAEKWKHTENMEIEAELCKSQTKFLQKSETSFLGGIDAKTFSGNMEFLF
jgi:hypothetical protein